MHIALNQLTAHLAKGLRPLYTLHGDEALLQQEALDTIRAVARAQGYTERSSFTVAGRRISCCTMSVRILRNSMASSPSLDRARVSL